MPDYQTAAGYRVEASEGLFKAYIFCHGCNHGWKVSNNGFTNAANRHAAGCRRVPTRR
jgi:hypothetical protein